MPSSDSPATTLTQLCAAGGEPVDYVALGPVFATASKLNPDPVIGVEEIRRCRSLIEKPLVAIGGITQENALDVLRAGADSVAVIAGLLPDAATAHSLRERMEQWQQLVKDGLVKGLGLIDSTTLVMGSMIGSGVFIVAADISRQVQSPGLMMMTWVVTAVLTLIAALSYGELAAAMPHAGGQYVYLREAFGPLAGFLFGWTMFMVIQTGTIAAVAVAFAKYTGIFFPSISDQNYLVGQRQHRRHHAAAAGHRRHRLPHAGSTRSGIRTGAMVQNVFTFAKIGALLGLVGAGFLVGRNPEAVASNFTDFWRNAGWNFDTVRLVGVAMVGSLFSSDAWNNVTFTAGEVRNPQAQSAALAGARRGHRVRALHRLQFVYLNVLPFDAIQHADEGSRGRRRRRRACSGPSAVQIMAAAIMISTFGCINGLILSGARVYYAMAKDRLFFRRPATLDPKTHAPVFSLGRAMRLGLPAHVERQLQRSARLCYLCCAALLHSDDRRPVRAPSHTPGYGAAVQGLRVSRAARGLHVGGRPDRSFAVDLQTELHVAGPHHRAVGRARIFYLAKESNAYEQ